MSDRWLIPASALTLGSYAAAFLMPRWTGMPSPNSNFIPVIVFWLSALLGTAALFAAWRPLMLLITRDADPLKTLGADLKSAPLFVLISGYLLAALNLTAFGFIKPQLGHLVSFSADPLLADLDQLLFLGSDGWRRVIWLHHPGLPQIYHQGWFGMVFLTFFCVLRDRQGPRRDALLLSYFALWSIFGPLVHIGLPAAGPLFWQELGLGDRFAQIPMGSQTVIAKEYLWDGYVGRSFNAAGGISAMPSLHLATMGWVMLALRNTRLFIPSAFCTLYMLAASVALGWHYVIDGIVGLFGAVLCFAACKLVLRSSNDELLRPPRSSLGIA